VDTTKVAGGVLSNNFANGLRCAPVNGWFCAFEKKTGEFIWHLESRTNNQMIVLEQFRQLPILLFSVRYMEQLQGGVGGARMVAYSGSVNKATGKVIWWPVEPRASNGNAQFHTFSIDVPGGAINLIGHTSWVQFYVDDGRKRPDDNAGAGGAPVPGVPGVAPGAGPGPVPVPVPLPAPGVRPGLPRFNPGLQPGGRLRLELPRGMQVPALGRDRLPPATK
jgi:hypothetical protein